MNIEKKILIAKTKKQLERSQKNESGKKYTVSVLGKEFLVYPNVFSPKYFNDSDFFSRKIPFIKNSSFLEVGCGAGVVSIFGALSGVKKVVATDINRYAILNTKKNVQKLKLNKKILVKQGDLFGPVKDMKFDQIFWNVPFLYTNKKDLSDLELATFDYQDRKKIQFIQEVKNYLNKDGVLLIGYSSTYGDINKIKKILKDNNFSGKVIAKEKSYFDKNPINLELIEARLIN